MWIELSEGLFYFGQGGITAIKQIDLRDKPDSFIMRSELYVGSVKISVVKETMEQINIKLGGSKNDN